MSLSLSPRGSVLPASTARGAGVTGRILVRGEQNYLRNNDNAAKIRALLLAGIRAAVLWQQLGGSRWTLFWSRRKYVATAKKFISYN